MSEAESAIHGPVFVPLDGSPLAERAVPYAVTLASALGAEIVLFTALHSPDLWYEVPVPGGYEANAHAHGEAYLNRIAAAISGPPVRTMVHPGFARAEILRAAEEAQAGVIVAASHGRSGLKRWLYGSVASHLARQSPWPLLIVGREVLSAPGAPVAFRRLAVPLDGSPLAEAALAPAASLAAAVGAELTLVRAVPWALELYPFAEPDLFLPDLDQQLAADAETYLQKTRAEKAPAATTMLVRGPVAETLLEFVAAQDIDLVLMTTHARAGLGRAFLGSTADRMLLGTAPVLLIRPREGGMGA